MKKNGFTLIELIATIGLLGMLATILITVSVKKINEAKEHSKKTLIESIELAAKQYVTDYKDELSDFQNKDYIYVSLQTLVEKNYLSNSLIDPTTNKSLPLTDTVYVTREQNGELYAVYDINQKENAKLTLNGSYNEYIKAGTTFTDLGVNAVSSDGTNISGSVTKTGIVDSTTPGTYKIKYEYGKISIVRNVIVYEGNLPSEGLIHVYINYNANEGTFGTKKYDYTGGEQTFIATNDGYYKLEVWGGQGGSYSTTYYGGYGGYSIGNIYLDTAEKLYINVGGAGEVSATFPVSGGYNGGGKGTGGYSGVTYRYGAGGGGATHIAKVSGLLSSLVSNKGVYSDEKGTYISEIILIVAGGGGGSFYYGQAYGSGASSGGYIGNTSTWTNSGHSYYLQPTGGTQNSGGLGGNSYVSHREQPGSFGQGGNIDTNNNLANGSGGGGGFYGGGGGGFSPGGGGSGYIGNSLLTQKYMYCYNCTTSDKVDTKTYTTTNVSDTPISNYAKSGDGAAIINQITYEQKSLASSKYPINDIPVPTREGYNFIGWFTDPVSGEKITSSTKITNKNNHELYAHWEVSS